MRSVDELLKYHHAPTLAADELGRLVGIQHHAQVHALPAPQRAHLHAPVSADAVTEEELALLIGFVYAGKGFGLARAVVRRGLPGDRPGSPGLDTADRGGSGVAEERGRDAPGLDVVPVPAHADAHRLVVLLASPAHALQLGD